MRYIAKEQALEALGLEPEIWNKDDPAQVQERNDWHYYWDAIEAVPELKVKPVLEARWILVDKKNGTGVCSHCNRQDHRDPMAKYCRYCGARMAEES